MNACTDFATLHKLINQTQRQQNQKFSDALKNGGPGGCTSVDECKTYCADTAHTDECVAFAKTHSLASQENLDQAKKISDLLKNGGPGGCKNNEECRAYCSKAENTQTCSDFAQKNGLVNKQDGERIQKFNELAKNGQTPGGCQTKEACETYCKDQSHKQECSDFAAKLGIINQDQANKIKTGSRGPGGCDSKDSCQAYCNDQSHHDECIKFGQDNGSIKPEGAESVRNAVSSLQEGLKNAPESVKACLQQQLGADVYDQILQGQFTPTPEAGKKISSCFAQYKEQQKKDNSQATAPPSSDKIKQCLLKKLNLSSVDDLQKQGLTTASPEVQTAVKSCQQELGVGQPSQDKQPIQPQTNSSDSAKIKLCLQEKLGNRFQDFVSGKLSRDSVEAQAAMKACGYPIKPAAPATTRPTSTPPQPSPSAGGASQEIVQKCKQQIMGDSKDYTKENYEKISQCIKSASNHP